ncbi:hypothetical protein AVEN_151475-1 [Araneus ventricosus]|uniref:Uncharacterized protein n=1 Tax=Araneus ventricosus TaxID=182803 RepID=A0A4Y2RXH2_ARAVE|nr:hypothetical protein AVEN_151475-1 [Araneus ventricosus]
MFFHEGKGTKSFEDLRTIDGVICETFREAGYKRGLLENDNQWEATSAEAAEKPGKSPPVPNNDINPLPDAETLIQISLNLIICGEH